MKNLVDELLFKQTGIMFQKLLKDLGLRGENQTSVLRALGLQEDHSGVQGAHELVDLKAQGTLDSFSPVNGQKLGSIIEATETDYETVIAGLTDTFKEWRKVPAPERGALVREIADALRDSRDDLGRLISWEVGKILPEGIGEVQEVIDVADFAVGLSRQLYGRTMHSERPEHRMYEQWHPLGIVGVITAFNFPMAVWGWNAMLAAVCGNVVLWKPSEHTPYSAIAINSICRTVAKNRGFPGLFSLVISDGPELGKRLAADKRIPLVSATGSCAMGRSVGTTVAERIGKSLLELGGNNAVIVLEDANMDLVIRSTVFGSVGTAGQRCTTTRRVLVARSREQEFLDRLITAYKQVAIGNPLNEGILMGPLIHKEAVRMYEEALVLIGKEGGEVLYGGEKLTGMPSDLYVLPTIVKAHKDMPLLQQEIFAPILYVVTIDSLDEALEIQNGVPQGLSSAIFTESLQSAERFLSALGSDCGIANVNLGTSGAEIGGAFGGEKETGGGRESGSDSWKQYMRRQTNTINYGSTLPLAQGIRFDLSE